MEAEQTGVGSVGRREERRHARPHGDDPFGVHAEKVEHLLADVFADGQHQIRSGHPGGPGPVSLGLRRCRQVMPGGAEGDQVVDRGDPRQAGLRPMRGVDELVGGERAGMEKRGQDMVGDGTFAGQAPNLRRGVPSDEAGDGQLAGQAGGRWQLRCQEPGGDPVDAPHGGGEACRVPADAPVAVAGDLEALQVEGETEWVQGAPRIRSISSRRRAMRAPFSVAALVASVRADDRAETSSSRLWSPSNRPSRRSSRRSIRSKRSKTEPRRGSMRYRRSHPRTVRWKRSIGDRLASAGEDVKQAGARTRAVLRSGRGPSPRRTALRRGDVQPARAAVAERDPP